MNYKFTIFTPVYNGELFFRRVFDSLKNQTYRNFEWIIVNDGSTDNSDELISSLITEVDWDITYLKQENKGKHVAWNRAVKISKGHLFIPADCDDSFLPETLEFFNAKWNLLLNRNSLSGMNVLCFNVQTKIPIGNLYPKDGFETNNLELAYKIKPKIKGEKWGCIRLDLLKKIPFPEVKAHFFTESYLWFSLAKNYNVVCYNKALRGYYEESTSLTNNVNKRDSNRINMFKVYNIWLISNFGIYLLINSPTTLKSSCIYVLKSHGFNVARRLKIIK